MRYVFSSLGVTAGGSSTLADTAAALAVGNWVELVTTGIDNALLSANTGGGAVGGNNNPYGNQAGWNPITKKIEFLSRDHGPAVPYTPFIEYSENTNSWVATNSGAPVGTLTHEGAGTAIRPDNGDHYKRANGGGVQPTPMYRKLASGGGWVTFTASPSVYTQIFVGCCWWPGSNTGATALSGKGAAGCLVVIELTFGEMLFYDPIADTWEQIAVTGVTPVDPYHTVAVYSPIYNCVVYGGGNGNQRVWRLNQNKTVTELTSCPVNIGVQNGNLACDPVSGKFILWGGGSNARKLYELDPSGSGTWTDLTATRSPPAAGLHGVSDPSGGSGGPDALISVGLPDHGVIAYISASGASYSNIFLYKHA